MTEQVSPPPQEEPRGVRAVEVALFLIFGLIPIGVLYWFASQGMNDTQGRQFEHERRLVMVSCMKALDDREECRGQVDRMVMECYAQHKVKETGAVRDREVFKACISRSKDGVFRVRTEAEKKADAKTMKDRRK